jgi:hypothetical protein
MEELVFGARRQQEDLNAARADVGSLQARLAADISNLDAGADPVSRQAMADAGERYNAAGAVLDRAASVGELLVAKRIVVEGLTATRIVRQHQGLPLGADLPDLDATVNQPTAVSHGGQEHVAYPGYHPDQPHFFGGGRVGVTQAPAGYYRTPFWKKAAAIGGAVVAGDLLGNALSDMFDGGLDGGGGFDNDSGGGGGGGGGGDGGGGDW